MAYVSQYEIDAQQDQRNRQNQAAIGNGILQGIQNMQENRQRAINEQRAKDAMTLQYASNGATPDVINQASSGDMSGIQKLYADNYQAKKKTEQAQLARDLEDAGLNRELKRSTIRSNDAATHEKSLPFEQSREGKEYVAKMGLEQEQARQKQANEKPAQNEFAAAGFAKRARMATADLDKLGPDIGTGTFSGISDMRIPFTDTTLVPEAWKPDTTKQFDQAARNFVTAVLRKESGAAISPSEYDNEMKKYFPQAGDGEEVLAQKRATREQAIANLEAEGSRAMPRIAGTSTIAPEIQHKIQQYTPDQKAQRLEQLRAKKAGVAMGGN